MARYDPLLILGIAGPNQNDGWLSDDEIDFFAKLLHEQFDYEFRDTWKFQLGMIEAIPPGKPHIHLLHSAAEDITAINAVEMEGGHWICTFYDGERIHVYDSVNNLRLDSQVLDKLKMLYPYYCFMTKPVKIHPVQRQPNSQDCDVFSIANAITLAYGGNPETTNYEMTGFRRHLLTIFENRQLLEFPRAANVNYRPKTNKSTTSTINTCTDQVMITKKQSNTFSVPPNSKGKFKNSLITQQLKSYSKTKSINSVKNAGNSSKLTNGPSKRKSDEVESKPMLKKSKPNKTNEKRLPKITEAQKNIILEGKWLNDLHMHHFGRILESCSNYVHQSSLYTETLHRIKPIEEIEKHIQILFCRATQHWVCSFYNAKKVIIYDSLRMGSLTED